MTQNKDQTLHSLIGIQPRHLRLIQLHLRNYKSLLLFRIERDDDSTEMIAELCYLDGLISKIMGDDLNERN